MQPHSALLFDFPKTARLTDASSGESLSLAEIQLQLSAWQQLLHALDARRIVFRAESSVQWALLDLACLAADLTLVPVPAYLSDSQWQHVLAEVEPDLIICHQQFNPVAALTFAADIQWQAAFGGFQLYQRQPTSQVEIPETTQKITFTSGSTGQPKGVCLAGSAQLQVAHSLVTRINIQAPRHLCLLPLPTLLENIAGVYAPLIAGGEVYIATEAARGFNGSRLENPGLLLSLISKVQPQTLILVPELLQLLIHACSQGWQPPACLQFIAVGGAKVAVDLLLQATACGLPVYQGYGLSECCSVVALSDVPALQASKSQLAQVGRVLPHLQVKIVNDEVWVKTPFLGYLGDVQPNGGKLSVASADLQTKSDSSSDVADWVATGDLGSLNADGTLVIWGRKKNLLISSLGRNINPEWVEAELQKTGLLQQAVLFGDSQPYCVALIYCANPAISDAELTAYVQSVNQQLPDYARAEKFIRLTTPLSEAQGTLTANGRPKRAAIASLYGAALANLYQQDQNNLSIRFTGDFVPAELPSASPNSIQQEYLL